MSSSGVAHSKLKAAASEVEAFSVKSAIRPGTRHSVSGVQEEVAPRTSTTVSSTVARQTASPPVTEAESSKPRKRSGLRGASAQGSQVPLAKHKFGPFVAGIIDAVQIHKCFGPLVLSKTIRRKTHLCIILNGVIFLGSMITYTVVVEPVVRWFGTLLPDHIAWIIHTSVTVFYKVVLIYPIYCISFVLSALYYQDIADAAFELSKKKQQTSGTPLNRLIDEAFRMLLNLIFIIEMNLLFYIPYVGPVIYFIHSCWLASIYCFEYRWMYQRWGSAARLDYFERHWLYFVGFGFPLSLVTYLCPRFVDYGVFALLFPIFILMSATAEPHELRKAPHCLRRLPVFVVVQWVSYFLLRLFEGRLLPPSRGGRNVTTRS